MIEARDESTNTKRVTLHVVEELPGDGLRRAFFRSTYGTEVREPLAETAELSRHFAVGAAIRVHELGNWRRWGERKTHRPVCIDSRTARSLTFAAKSSAILYICEEV